LQPLGVKEAAEQKRSYLYSCAIHMYYLTV
jgi:hypothetical protein